MNLNIGRPERLTHLTAERGDASVLASILRVLETQEFDARKDSARNSFTEFHR